MDIENLLANTLENIKGIIDVNNVIGRPIHSNDNITIVPVSKVSFGFLTGAGEYSESLPKTKTDDLPHAGGSGGGVSIAPIGFLICNEGKQEFIKIDKNGSENKWAELIQATMNVVKEYEKH